MTDEKKESIDKDEAKSSQPADKGKTCNQTSCCKGTCCDTASQGCGDCVNCE